ncbi:MAG: hypothetical protein LBJ09_00550 [Clostridiales bacterium]|jgi:uncharacterized alkaline shock family protein YloU|nr:hypothetical protein [Clostridiales bacterium]
MIVYALVGESGTGKSYNSLRVAKENNIYYVIDDGILIHKNKILCGKSAKKERTKVASVKCALFFDKKHRDDMKKTIKEKKINFLLILGTSKKMVEKIAENLGPFKISKFISMEQISSSEIIEYAKKMRQEQGKHIIPVPTLEVRKHFLGYFLDPIKLSFIRKNKVIVEEKTVIRPSFSFFGEYFVSNKVIFDICVYEILKFKEVQKIVNVRIFGIKIKKLSLVIDLILLYPSDLKGVCSKVSKILRKKIEDFTSLNVKNIKVNVKTIVFKK